MDFKKVLNTFYSNTSSFNQNIKSLTEFNEFDALFNNELQSIVLVDLDGKILKMNQKFLDSLNSIQGISIEPGLPVIDLVSERNKAQFLLDFNEAKGGNKIISERWVKDLTGHDFCFIYEYTPIKKKNKIVAVLMSILDITSIRATNLILNNNEQQYLALVDGHHSALFISKVDGTILNSNDSGTEMFGYTREEFLKMNIRDIIDHSDLRLEQYLEERKESGVVTGELVGLKKNSQRFSIEFSSVLFTNSITGEIQTSTLINDISDRKRDEKIAKETNIVAKIGGWELDLMSNELYWTDVTKGIHEVDLHYTPKLENAIDFYKVGESKKRISELVEKAITKGESFEEDFEIITAKGNSRWVRSKCLVDFYDGKAIRIYGTFQDINQQKLNDINLEKSLNELKQQRFALDQHTLVSVTDLEGKIIYVNDKFAEISGYEKSELIGNSNKLLKSTFHSVDFFKNMNETIYSGNVWNGEICNMKKNGDQYWLRMTIVPFKDHITGSVVQFISICTDITEKRIEETRLKLLESVITNTKDAVIITEAEPFTLPGPKIVYVNNAFCEMTGYSQEEVIGKTPRILQGPLTDREELHKLGEALRKWESTEIEIINYKKNGEHFWVNFSVVPIADETGWFTHWISVQRDTTNRRKLEEERKHLIDELSSSIAELKQFTYITSHNLRAPVTNLLGIFSILDTSTIQDSFTLELIEGLRKSTLNLNETLNDLIKILIIKENTNLTLSKVNIPETLEHVKKSIENLLLNKNANIQVDFSAFNSIDFNKSYLESIFLNLITNSIRYAYPERKIEIKIRTEIKKNKLKLIYSDNGLGMDMNRVKDQIFGLYKRFHNHPESKGVGLYLVHSQVTSLGGQIEVDSEVNVGTTFTITF